MKRIIPIILILLAATGIKAGAQARYSVSGYITDKNSGEPLIGVAVIDKATGSGTVTGNTGYYSIRLPEGSRTLMIRYMGYAEASRDIVLKQNTSLNVQIHEDTDQLQSAVVTASRGETGVLGTQMSAIEVPVSQIKAIPAIGGEVDVIKALQLLPGVQSGNEASAGLYVRGGGADENLLLMDGVPLYNVSHLFGFFSVFNADAIKNVTLYKGSFPARFGGHLSSVVDVRMNDGNDQKIHGTASIGLISSKVNLEGPIIKGRTTINISARRTYLDLLAKPAIAYANAQEKINNPDAYTTFDGGYDFYDFNAKLTHRFNNNDRLSFSFYSGDDEAALSYTDHFNYKGDEQTAPYASSAKMNFGWDWGNMVTSLRWSHELSPTLYLIAGTSYTRYRSHLAMGLKEATPYYTANVSIGYNSLIDDASALADFEWKPSPEHDIKFGTVYTYHTFKPGIVSVNIKETSGISQEAGIDVQQEIGNIPMSAHEAAIYAEDNYSITEWLKANLGFRTSLYHIGKKTYASIEPRLSARALITDELSAKGSYSEMSQYIHLLCNSNLSLPSDLWVPVSERIKPMRSRQGALGLFYSPDIYEFSVEGYYKSMDNVLEYKDGASYMSTGSGWEEKVCMGRGWSYGVEFLAQKRSGKTTGWIGYTLSKSMRQFDKAGNIINNGKPFPAKYDRRHDLSITVTHEFSKKFDASATFVYASGNCGSLPFEYMRTESPEGFLRAYKYLEHRNNYRMPAYNRLDIGMNWHKQHRRGEGIWSLSVYNVYNRLNPYLLRVGHELWYDGEELKERRMLLKVSIFPIIPSISYTYKF